MNSCRETTKMGVPPDNRRVLVSVPENAPASAFPVACCGVSERTTIKWNHFLTFRRFPAARYRELQPYVAGADTRGRKEGRLYYSRSLRSAQSRERVLSFVVAASDS
jgi:hypothetical protein